MKVTQHWLREFTPLDITTRALAERLTLLGLEVEAVLPVAPPCSGVVVGEVLSSGRHPNAEKLSLCEVTTDGADRLQIICGAANVRAGLKVAVARVGAVLPDDLVIKAAKLRGLESNGMLCSARELGLGEEHSGILELSPDAVLGQDVRVALDLDDAILEVKATPNRGDCMSVLGIARDYSAAHQGRYLTYRPLPVPARHGDRIATRVDAPEACPLFATRVIRGIDAGAQSPAWLRERLRRVGQNSISPIVDVTNYVMMELGQPLHAYDLERLTGGIVVRMAGAGERLTLLDGKEYVLEPDCLVIADERGALGLAGIMGGRDSAISATTTAVVLEAAHFTPAAVAGRARRVGLITDAAQRFERGVDPTLPERALERATQLLLQIAGGEPGPVASTRGGADRFQVAGDASGGIGQVDVEQGGDGAGIVDVADGRPSVPWITLRRARLAALLGAHVPDAEVQSLLAAVTGEVESCEVGWRVRAPAHRFDLSIEADLIEEVARLRGFDRIAEIHAAAAQVAGYASESRIATERLLLALADAGYREAITYTFVDPLLQREIFPNEPTLALANAISPELSEMRVSLWPGLIQAARDNLRRQQPRVRLCEYGKKFVLAKPAAGSTAESTIGTGDGSTASSTIGAGSGSNADSAAGIVEGSNAGTALGLSSGSRGTPGELHEIDTLAGIATSARWPEQWGAQREPLDFYDVKADLERLFALTGRGAEFRFVADASLPCLRPGRTARIHREGVAVGWLGELHPQLAERLGMPANTLLFEVETESAFRSKSPEFKKISKFPTVRRDLAIVVDEAVPLAVLQETVTVSASGLLSELRVFDVYRGPGVESGRKSIALGLILQDSSRTLTDVDADAVVTAVVSRLRDVLSASIRDQ